MATGNAPLLTLGGVVTRPVTGVSPSRLAVVWRADDRRDLVRHYVLAARQVAEKSAEQVAAGE